MAQNAAAGSARAIVANGATALVFTAVGNSCAYVLYRPFVPSAIMNPWAAAVALLLLFHAGVMVSALIRIDRVGHRDRVTRLLRRALELWTLGIALGVIWALMPYGPVELQLATMIFVASYAAAVVLSGADQEASNALLVVAVILSLIVVSSYQEVHYWPYIDLFLVTFLASLLVLDRTLQGGMIALRSARDARTQFMAAASHDLGQPLQAARLFFEQALAAPDATHRAAAARNTRSALGAMERLIHQMLDHLRLDEGVMEPDIAVVEAGPLIAGVVTQFAPLAALSDLTLKALDSRLRLCGDVALVERALGNLIDNALRHSAGTRVLVGARRHGAMVRLWVIDDGRGVPVAERPGLFDPFVQGGADHRPRGGLGIGLSSVRGLMALMRGSVGLDPKWAGGAAFFLELPPES